MTKILSLLGGGAKALEYFIFGPEYNFPGNCYSEGIVRDPQILKSMAKAHTMIGAAEELLFPAQRVESDLAIIQPRSAAIWDAHGLDIVQLVKKGKLLGGATLSSTTDYYAETYGLYNALAIAMNRPTDFIDETALLNATLLSRFKVLVLTEPNVPVKALMGLLAWVEAGGTLITVPGASTADEYDEPSTLLQTARKMTEAPQERLIIGSWGYHLGTGKATCWNWNVTLQGNCTGVPGVVANGMLYTGATLINPSPQSQNLTRAYVHVYVKHVLHCTCTLIHLYLRTVRPSTLY
jgi:hypothetical protein